MEASGSIVTWVRSSTEAMVGYSRVVNIEAETVSVTKDRAARLDTYVDIMAIMAFTEVMAVYMENESGVVAKEAEETVVYML